MKEKITKTIKILAVFLTGYLIFLGCGFFAVKYGITNTAGVIDSNNDQFQESALFEKENVEVNPPDNLINSGNETATDLGNGALKKQIEDLTLIKKKKDENFCKLNAIGEFSAINAERIFSTYQKTQSDGLISKMILAVSLRLKDNLAYQNKISFCENIPKEQDYSVKVLGWDSSRKNENVFSWMNKEEWKAIEQAVLKDQKIINEVAERVGIAPRLIVSSLIVEQLRLFHSQRELFKKFFEPLKILGNATKISLGVMGIKEATAIETERHLKDSNSPYYLGVEYENLLDLNSEDSAKERFQRLTDEKSHYYSYLYGAVYLKEMLMQWERAGFSINISPEIIGTLFNVGFAQSKPNAEPKVGGSKITVGDGTYSFGSLAYEFYYSGEMLEEFPYITK